MDHTQQVNKSKYQPKTSTWKTELCSRSGIRGFLFLRRLRSIIGEHPIDSRTVQLQGNNVFSNQKNISALLAPPPSPVADTIEALDMTKHAPVGVQPLVSTKKETNPWGMASGVGNAILWAPTLPERWTRISCESTHSVNYRLEEISTVISGARPDKLSDKMSPVLNARSLPLSSSIGRCAQRPMEIFRDDSYQRQAAIVESDQSDYSHEPVFAATDRRIMDQPTVLSTICNRDQRLQGPRSARDHDFNARLCDRNDPDCTYSSQFTCQHFHSPPSKCILNSSGSIIAHKHCISRKYALPDRFGDCILANIPILKHICCQWKELDRKDWPLLRERFYGMEKSVEWQQTRKIHDKWATVGEGWIGATIIEDMLSDEGKSLNEELKNEF